MKKESQKKRNSDKVEIFKTGGGTPNLLSTSLDEQLAAMCALIEPLSCRFDCDYDYETAVSSGTQGNCSSLSKVKKFHKNPGKLYALPRLQKHLKSENQSASLMLLLKQQKQPMPEKLQWKGIMNRLHNLGKKSIELP
ncbi:hypothetical protein TNCV_4023651 [Trichonephila clavipes]|nr:hypothetical protein TNCV_4023651 [Trichonephila clavipes]